jgi:hypothetical protein
MLCAIRLQVTNMSIHSAHRRLSVLLCVLVLGITACATTGQAPPLPPALQFSSYQFDSTSPLENRITTTPNFVLDYLNKYDKVDVYRNYSPNDSELSLARDYLRQLPQGYQSVLQSRLLGIYFVQNFMGSALTEFVFDDSKNLYAFLAVNSAALSTPISEWVTLRDQSCFKADGSVTQVSSDCGSYYTGLMYALLHESSHVVDATAHYHAKPSPTDEKAFPFISPVWKGFSQPVPRFDFPERKELVFYGLNGGTKLPLKQALQAYRDLATTPFASLYGSQSILEDYAELFTWTYYTEVLHQHYQTTVTQEGQSPYTYSPMDNPLIQERLPELIHLAE